MARIRYIKPDFFFDEHLADLKFECRIAFAGLWCHADRSGRLEDSPKKIKALIFPYDIVDMDEILNELCKKPFIYRYEVDGKRYIQIINFEEHQKPHHTEKNSEIPPYKQTLTVKQPLKHGEKKVGMGKGMEKGSVHDTVHAPHTFPLEEIKLFFKDNGHSEDEAVKFFRNFEGVGWMSGSTRITNWKYKALNWISNIKGEKKEKADEPKPFPVAKHYGPQTTCA